MAITRSGVVHRPLTGFFQKGETPCEKLGINGEQDASLLGGQDAVWLPIFFTFLAIEYRALDLRMGGGLR